MKSEAQEKTMDAAEIAVGDIRPNQGQPRRIFDREGLERLAASIERYGVIQPLSVRRLADGAFELIAGERRLRAAKLAGLASVPCVILEADPATGEEMAFIENLQRRDLDMFEQAEAIERLAARYHMRQSDIAEKLGLSQPAVANKLRLLRLSDGERSLILSGGLTERHARAALRLEDPAERRRVLEAAARRALTVEKTEELVEKALAQPAARKRKVIIQDIRLFFNTLDNALSLVKKAGYRARAERTEYEDRYEIVVTIPK